MRLLSLMALCLVLNACVPCGYDGGDRKYYQAQSPEAGYMPVSRGGVYRVLGYEIQEGQQMRDFFDEFEEPMHAKYMGNDVILWTYYVSPRDGKIVRYCELNEYPQQSLCRLDVEFYKTYVRRASSNCQ